MQSTPSLPSPPGPLWLGVVAPDRVYLCVKENFLTSKLSANGWIMINWNAWNRIGGLEPGRTVPWGSRMPMIAYNDRLPAEPEHTRPDPCTDKTQSQSSASQRVVLHPAWRLSLFVFRPTNRTTMAQGLFLGGSVRRAIAQIRPAFPKMRRAQTAFPSKEPEWTDPWGLRMSVKAHLDRLPQEPGHTR